MTYWTVFRRAENIRFPLAFTRVPPGSSGQKQALTPSTSRLPWRRKAGPESQRNSEALGRKNGRGPSFGHRDICCIISDHETFWLVRAPALLCTVGSEHDPCAGKPAASSGGGDL